MTRNREIKTMPFLPQRQDNLELATLIIEDFIPVACKFYNNVDFSVKRFLGDSENPDELYSSSFYESVNLFVDYLVNNKSFDLSSVPDSQFIPASTEVFIGFYPPNSQWGGNPDNTDVVNAVNGLSDLLTNIEVGVSQVNGNFLPVLENILTSLSDLSDIKALLEHRNSYLDAQIYVADLANTRLHDLNVKNADILAKLTQIEVNTQ